MSGMSLSDEVSKDLSAVASVCHTRDADDVSLHVAKCHANMGVSINNDWVLVNWSQLGRWLSLSKRAIGLLRLRHRSEQRRLNFSCCECTLYFRSHLQLLKHSICKPLIVRVISLVHILVSCGLRFLLLQHVTLNLLRFLWYMGNLDLK